jgi:hypothetical protein
VGAVVGQQPAVADALHRDTERWPRFFGLLADGNQTWCVHAAVLVVFVSQTLRDGSDSSAPVTLLRHRLGLDEPGVSGLDDGCVVHGMAGFDYERARTELGCQAAFA